MIARRIVVIGDVMLDVVVKPTALIALTSDTPAQVRLSRGGGAANIAVALASEGHGVTFLGASGDDTPARLFVDALRDANVRAVLVQVGASTGVVVALVSEDGQRAMLTDRGANRFLTWDHVASQLDRPFDHLHVSGYTLLDVATREVGIGALARAHELGHATSVDACSVAPLSAVTPRVFLDAARGASTLFANEEEALLLSSCADVGAALERLAEDFTEVVVTRGANGARARNANVTVDVPASSDEVFDTTGAGDAATGTYLARRLSGGSVDDALAAAMEAASVVVRGLGARG